MSLAPVGSRGAAIRPTSNRRRYAWLGVLVLIAAGIGLGLQFWTDGFSKETRTADQSKESVDAADSTRKSPASATDRHMTVLQPKPQPESAASADTADMSARRQPQSPQQEEKAAGGGERVASATPFSDRQNTLYPPASQQGEQKKGADPSSEKQNPPGSGSGDGKQAPLPLLQNTGLEIQALSWDPDPENRIAVINSRLCREGDRLGSYRVITINPDDVVVARGSNRGRLVITRH